MPVNAKVANHSGLGLQDTVLQQITEVHLNEASDISLDITPQDIASLSRSGDDLVLTLQNGEVITLDGFYIDPQEQSHLYLEGDEFAGDIYRIDMASTSPGNVPYEAIPVENTIESAVLGAPFSAAGTTLAALGVIGATGLMLGGVNSGGGDDEDSNTSVSPDAPIISSVTDNVEPSTGELESGSDTNDTTPTLTGTAGAGSSVAIYDGDTLLDTVEADGEGNWSLELSVPLSEGEHSLTAVATDPEGNISDASDAFIITIDTLPPDVPELENSDGTALSGTGEPGSAITVVNNKGEIVGETTVDDDGNFTLDLSPEQEDGAELTATATDEAGNESESSAPITVDAAAPEAPFITAVNDNAEPVTGELSSGDSTNDQTPILMGTAEAGSSVAVYDGDTLLKTVEADAEGNWSLELSEPLAEGEHNLSAIATDASGNVSDPSDAFVITIDVTVPEAPVLEETDGTTLAGTGEPGAIVDITDGDGNIVASIEVGDDGNFEITLDPALEDGTQLTATATDPAGNTSGSSNPVIVDTATDTTPPAAGENSIAFGDGGDGFLNADEIGNVTLTGTIEAGLDSSNVQLVITDGEGGSVTIDTADITVDGTTLTVAGQDLSGLAEGELTATLTVTDDSDNAADFTADSVKDTTAPQAPVLEETDGTTLAGTGEPGATVDITDGDGNIVASIEVGDDGNFEITLDPALEDDTELTATATDPAGNASGPSNPVTVDTATDTTPPAEGDNSISFGDGDDGFLNADEVNNVTLTGTIEDGLDSDNVQLVITDGEGGSVTIDTADITVDGTTLTVAGQDLSELAEGELTATLTVTDDSNNANDFTAGSVKDTTAPEAPVLEETDGTTLAGTGEPGATVDITDGDGNIVASIEVGDDGNFEITLDPALEDGTELTARATDPAGNTSGPSNPVIVDTATDTTPPAEGDNSIAFGDGGDGFLNADEIGNVTLSGTIEEGLDSGNVQLVITDGQGGSVTVDTADITVDGTTLTVAGQDLSSLAEGELTATLTITDDSDNAAEFSDSATKDTTAPEAPVLEETDGTTLAGSGEPGATIEITDGNGNPITTTEVEEDGTFSIELDPMPEDGTELTATATDPAGNTSAPSNPVIVDTATDTTPPAAGENSIAFGDGGDGFLNADEIGNVTLSGTIEDGLDSSNVQLIITDGAGGSVTVDTADITVDGTTLTVAGQDLSGLAEGELTATLTVTDDSDNAADFTAYSVKDTTAPQAPVLEETDGTTLAGSGEPGATIEITDGNGNPITTTEVEEDGTFSIELDPMPEDGTELTATATDPAGNTSAPSNPVIVDTATDTTPPAAGENSIAFGDGGDGFLNADEIGNVTLSGTIEDGLDSSNVQLIITDGAGGFVTVDTADITVDGTTLTVAGQDLSGLAEGELTATLTVTDNSDNAADFTADSVKDTVTDTPTLNDTDGTTLSGTGEPDATIEITDSNGNPVATTEVGEDGTFSIELDPMPEDGTELTATATDPAGNTSGPSNPVIVDTATDTTPPAAGENSIAFGDGDDGFLNADEIGNVTLSGTIEDGLDSSNVQLIINDGAGGFVTVDTADITVDGTTLTVAGQDLSGLAEGELTATLTVTDDAGNAADFTADSLKDTTAPQAPVLEETDGTTLAGTGEPGATVDITDGNGNPVATTEVEEDGTFSVDLDPMPGDGTELTATATDPAGNTSGPSNPVTVDSNTDTTPPAEGDNSIAFGDGGDGFLNADEIGNVTLSGTIEDGLDSSNVQLVITDGEGGSVTIDTADITVDGTTLTVAGQDLSELAEGELTATLTVTDNAGNAAQFDDVATKDTIAPDAPVLEATDGSELTGTGEPNTTVTITDGNGNVIGSADVDEEGNFTAPLNPAQEDDVDLTATVTDDAGNTSGPATATVDATAPVAADNSIAFGDGDDGFLNADEIGNVTLSGTIEDGLDSGNIQLVITDGAGGSVTVDTADITVDGSTLTVAGQDLSELAEGELTATLTVTDNAGNAAQFDDVATKDTIAPDAPVLEATDGSELTGTGEANTTVTITDGNGNVIGSADVDEEGNFTAPLNPAQEDGADLTATVTDDAGNTSGPATATVDATAPVAADNSIAFGDGDDGFLNADEIGNVNLTGTIEDGLNSGNVQLVITDGAGGSVTVDTADITIDGTILTVAGQDLSELAEGELTATLTVTDNAGNAAQFDDVATKDTIAPDAPVLEATDGSELTGTGEPNTTVTITDGNGNVIGSADVDEEGNFTAPLNPAQEDGADLTATVTDDAGNTSGPTTATVDATSPGGEDGTDAPVLTIDEAADGVTAAELADGLQTSVTLTNGTEEGDTVTVTLDDGNGGTITGEAIVTAQDITNDSIAVEVTDAIADGSYTATAVITDALGNSSAESNAIDVNVDATAPDAPILELVNDSNVDGDRVTNEGEVLVSGLEAGATWEYSVNGGTDWQAGTGNSFVLGEGVYATGDVQARQIDVAGNTSETGNLEGLTVDTTSPVTPTLSLTTDTNIDGDNITSIGEVTVDGLEEAATWEYSIDGGNTWEIGIGATFDLDQGIYNDDSIQVRQSDLAGNTSDIVALNAEIDALAPTTTVTIDAISDDTGTAGDFITSDNDGLTITATLDAALAEGETLQYSTDGVTWVDITTSVNGTNISYVDTALTESSTVQLKVQDTAGNDGARAERPIVIDTVAPTTTVTIDAISVDTGLPDDFITSDNNGLTLTGTLDAPLEGGEALLYSVDGGVTWVDITSSVSGSAINHDDATLTESATVQLKVRDTAGNDGPVAEKAIIIDTIAPDTTVTIDSISLDSGIPDDFITNDNDGLTITATLAAPLAADETLQYSTDGTTWIDVPAASVTGTAVSYDSGLTESATVQLRVQDAAGNTGPETSQDVVIDTTTPTTTVTIDAISEDTGTAGDFITSDNDGLTITATLAAPLAADETLQYSTDGTTWIDVPAASVIGTAVSYDSGLTESATVQLRVQDAAGNIGPATSQDVVIDATAPSAADNSIDFVDGGDETLSLDEITSVQLTGAVEDGIDSNDVVITITDSESGSISVDVADITITDGILSTTGQDLSGLAEGELTVTMNVTDEAGNSTDFIDTSTKDTVATLSTGSTAVTEDALGTSAPAAAPALMAFSFASFAALPASDNDATVDDTVSMGQLTYTNVSDTASFALEVPTDATLTQDGAELDWVLSEDGKTLQAVNNAGDIAATVLQISIDDRGSYTTELFSELDHTLQGADSLNFSVGVVLTDGEEVIDSSISVKVIDDTPELSKSFLHHDVTAAGEAVGDDEGDNLLGSAGFGADGGYISSITFDGVTFSIEQDALTQDFNVTTSGASELLDLSTPVSVANDGMTLTTLLGETFTIDLVTGDYTYDYDGDLALVDNGNTAPTPAINQSGGLLGIINLDALGLIDISEQQIFTVSDPDNDLTSVSLEYTAVLSLTGFEWAYNEELATELGLQVTPTFDPGFLGIGDVAGLTITPLEGSSTMDAQAVNELLATVFLPDSVLGLNLVPTVTLSATDSEGTVDTSATDLLDLSLLTAGGSGANVLTGTDNADLTTLTAPADTSTRLYGYDGDDTITGSNQADILRGGADNDSMNGGAGSDLMIGGTGNDTMTGDAGIDIFRWEDGHEGAVGAPATDLITDFDPSGLTAGSSGDIIDLRTLLEGEGYVTAEISNLSRYLNFAEQVGDTVLSISTAGDFTGETTDSDLVDQIITFEGTSLLQGGEDSADLIARLISEGKLLVDEATSTTVLEDITREVDLTYTDGDGDSVQGKLEFSGDAPSITDTSNSAPTIVGASQQLLGLVGLDALGLVDLSQNALFVADADGNLQSVTIAFSPLLNVDLSSLLGAPELTVNTALAEEFGLSVETTSSAGLLGLLAPSASVTISAAEGETIDNLQINELLSTLDFNQSDLLSLSLLDYLTVSATDDDGATTSLSLSSLLDANVLDSGEGSSVFIDETGADVLDASAAGINVSLYGLEGDDALTGGSGNDLLRGGEGNDTLTGGAGNDLLFGEAGDNTFDGGLGDDTIVTSTLDFSIDGSLGEDTVQFDGTGESIDLSSLLDTNTGTSEMLNIEVLDISESSETGSTLTLDTDAVLNLTDDNDTLRIEGDSNDSVQADGAEMTGQEVINGATYDTYALGSATLYIDQDVTVTTNNA